MKTVSFTEFRRNASALLDLVEKGERLRVVRHGRPIATVLPATETGAEPAWKRPRSRLRIRSGASLAKAVIEDRDRSR
jgi:prevent-host-death family protein